jgi:hypothetical protein
VCGIIFTSGEVSRYYAVRLPQLNQRPKSEWRGPCPLHQGDGDNFSVEPGTGLWFCHSKCGGGDILALERALTGKRFPAAKSEVFQLLGRVEPDSASASFGAGCGTRKRHNVERTALHIAYWRRGRIVQLEHAKSTAFEASDWLLGVQSSRELYQLEANPGSSVELYCAHLQRNAEEAAELIRWAREEERLTQILTAALVLMLAPVGDPRDES